MHLERELLYPPTDKTQNCSIHLNRKQNCSIHLQIQLRIALRIVQPLNIKWLILQRERTSYNSIIIIITIKHYYHYYHQALLLLLPSSIIIIITIKHYYHYYHQALLSLLPSSSKSMQKQFRELRKLSKKRAIPQSKTRKICVGHPFKGCQSIVNAQLYTRNFLKTYSA